jgi:hypothetical protein
VNSLAHTLKPQFGRTWHEAVAIVQELASVTDELDVLPLPADTPCSDAAGASSPRRRQVPIATSGDREPRTTAPAAASAFGLVEQVRLVSPTDDFRERMLVSAAKAWQFRPARLDGRPVRFQMQFPITISGERR